MSQETNPSPPKPTARRIVQQVVLSAMFVWGVANPTGHAIRTLVVSDNSDMEAMHGPVRRRLAVLGDDLPLQGTVGYTTNRHPKPNQPLFARWYDRYRLAQFHLAPLKLEPGREGLRNELVIGDFRNDEKMQRWLSKRPVRVIHKYGDGLVLFEGYGQ